jgi:isopentenyl diphosphate isomerase/L-lactate dehydrogenase-like FMN-dependent dehydrogenase
MVDMMREIERKYETTDDGAAAGGLPGVKKAIDIFKTEIDLVMGQIGAPSLDQLGPDFLWRDDWPRNR